jgi:hypothetical protein
MDEQTAQAGEVLQLPDARRRRLKELEDVIGSGWSEVVRVGQALREIRDEGLYLELDGGISFEDYCKHRWSLPKATAYQRIDAADIHDATSAIADAIPISTEAVGRELAPLLRGKNGGGPHRVAQAWARVSERYRGQRPPTAREVRRVLVEEKLRPRVGQVTTGKPNTRILLGQVGERLVNLEKRLDWFLNREIPAASRVAATTGDLARDYADRCEALARSLREFADTTSESRPS